MSSRSSRGSPDPIPDHAEIYRTQAEAYDRLVGAEDCEGRLLEALGAVMPLAGSTVLEVGMGTGRLTALLSGAGARVLGCDRAAAMLARARRRLPEARVVLADASALPARPAAFDAAVAGWVFGHFTEWGAPAIDDALAEMRRAVRPGGRLVILETWGTGGDAPGPPTEGLARYYRRLEALGFHRRVVETDYLFADVEEAATVCGWFFGADLAERIRARGWRRVPEWTAIFAAVSG